MRISRCGCSQTKTNELPVFRLSVKIAEPKIASGNAKKQAKALGPGQLAVHNKILHYRHAGGCKQGCIYPLDAPSQSDY